MSAHEWLTTFTVRGWSRRGIALALAVGGLANFASCAYESVRWGTF